jgi:hypothetical protein
LKERRLYMKNVTLKVDDMARVLCDRTQGEVQRGLVRYDSIHESARQRGSFVRPEPLDDEAVLQRALDVGVKSLLRRRAPNMVISLRPDGDDYLRKYKKGDVLRVSVSLPIGAEVLMMVGSAADGPNFDAVNFTFGPVNLISWWGSGPVPLSEFTYLTCDDLLSVFKDKETKVDVRVELVAMCRADDATFDGYRIHVRCDEQDIAIRTRVQPTAQVYPCPCVPFRYTFALHPHAAPVRAVLDRVRAAVVLPHVWPDASVRLAGVSGNKPTVVEVLADFQAASEADAAKTREELLIAVLEAVDRAGGKIVDLPSDKVEVASHWRG